MAIVERYEGLEPTVANLRLILGVATARLLSDRLGGRRLYVPRDPGPNHPISAAIGHEAAMQLAAAFPSEKIDVPMAPAKQEEIRRMRANGMTVSTIAREAGCTERWVYRTLAAPEGPQTQAPGLFDWR